MKILMINSVCGILSTGRICTDLATELENKGHTVKILYGRGNVPDEYKRFAVKIGSDVGVNLHALKARLFDDSGFGSYFATKKIIKWIKEFNPDIIHLHNIHGYYINIKLLFEYLKTTDIKIFWTFHDAWALTGHCACFMDCDKWKTHCEKCPRIHYYPESLYLDKSKKHFDIKRELFSGVKNLTIVTPSMWLLNIVKESYLKEYNCYLINNGINTEVFKPTESDFRKKHHLEDRIILLGVASVWSNLKGLEVFSELAKRLPENYKIVVVGASKNQIKTLPENILAIERTDSVTELAEIYTVADIFVNPTLNDNYPTVNLEAISCGTPVISFDTGGSGESAVKFGLKVPQGDIDALVSAILNFDYDIKPDENFDCDKKTAVNAYINLYEKGNN